MMPSRRSKSKERDRKRIYREKRSNEKIEIEKEQLRHRMVKRRNEMSVSEKGEAKRQAREGMRKLRDGGKKVKRLGNPLWPQGVKFCDTELYPRELERSRNRMKIIRASFTSLEKEVENKEAKERMRKRRAAQTVEERQAYNEKCRQKMRELRNKRKNMNDYSHQTSDEEGNGSSDVVKRINDEHRNLKETEHAVKDVEMENIQYETGLDSCVCDIDINCPHCEAVKEAEDYLYETITWEEKERFEREELEQYRNMKKTERKQKRKALKEKAMKPLPPLPSRELSEYEKIREELIAERKKEWAIYEKEWDKKWEDTKKTKKGK